MALVRKTRVTPHGYPDTVISAGIGDVTNVHNVHTHALSTNNELLWTESGGKDWAYKRRRAKQARRGENVQYVGDIGHEFMLQRGIVDLNPLQVNIKAPYVLDGWYAIEGSQFAYRNSYSCAGPVLPTAASLYYYGTKAIAEVSPSNPHAGLATMLGELKKDGLPSLDFLRGKDSPLKKGASGYLEFEFALKPLIEDLKDLYASVTRSQYIMSQYRRDAGRPVRRRFTFMPERTTTRTLHKAGVYPNPVGATQCYRRKWNRFKTVSTEKKRWFSGSFTYFSIPSHGDFAELERIYREANHLFGTAISPELVWNLMPWSWAIDWVVNIGDIIHNISSFLTDGLVMNYGYVMEHVRVQTIYELIGGAYYNGYAPVLSESYLQESKVRYRATPFGFGLNPNDFSARQWAILGALGITRAPKQLL